MSSTSCCLKFPNGQSGNFLLWAIVHLSSPIQNPIGQRGLRTRGLKNTLTIVWLLNLALLHKAYPDVSSYLSHH